MTHPPIICRRCGLRMPDADEIGLALAAKLMSDLNDEPGEPGEMNVCWCQSESTTLCTSTEQPPNLDFYDKHSK